jgi:peptide/nickel transport system substrate-binding protein
MKFLGLLGAAALIATCATGFQPAAAQTARTGGTIRMTAPFGASFSSLDIHTTPRSQDGIVALALHRQLYRWDSANSKPKLELATEVAASGGGTVYTYRLRQDAYFHNGRRMTADDIIWTYTRLMDGTKGFPGARYARLIKGAADVEKGTAATIAGLRKIDDFTLEMSLTEKADPGYLFFNMTTSILPREAVERGDFASNPVGLGPFKFKEHIPGSRLVADRWEKFYQPGRPYLDHFVIQIMPEAAARDVAFRSGEIDTSILGPAQYVSYRADPKLSKGILEVAEVFTRHMGMNPAFKPFADRRVRQAINHAIDTDLIIKRLVKDKAYRATSWLPLSSPAYDKTIKPYAFDPALAKKLLTEAGYPDGFEFEWTTSQNESWGLPIVEAVIPMLARVGIKVKTKLIEASVLIEEILKGQPQAYILSSGTGPDSLAALKCFHSATPRTSCNYLSFNNPAVDRLIDEAGQSDDAEIRIDLMKQADRLIHDEAPIWFFNYNKAVLAYQPWVHGLQANATELTHQYPEDIWVTEASPVAK